MITTPKENRTLDTALILILLSVFAVTVLMTVIFSANAYKSISENADKNFNQISPLSYIASKVRQADTYNAFRLEDKEGATALVIKTFDGDEVYETWIYNYDGYIYEVYIDENTDFSLSDGIAIYENNRLEFFIDNDKSLTIYNYGLSDEAMKLTLSFRSFSN